MRRVCLLGLILGLTPIIALSQSVPNKPTAVGSVSAATNDDPISQALDLYHKGEFDAAIARYREFLKLRPGSPDSYAGIVRCYLKQKNVEQAARAADEGIAQTTSPRLRVARAEVWFRQGKLAEAEKEWVDIVNTGYPEARAYLGLYRMRNAVAMYKSAKKMIEKAHEIDPNDSDIQGEWIGTLSRSERIKYLQDSLAGANNWDADRRTDVADYLKYLQERSKQKNNRPCRMVSKIAATETKMVRLLDDPLHLRGYGLDVALNGHKSPLMIDTGASGILVKRSVAEHAGISKISETKIGGIGKKGRRNGFVGVADSIKIGELEFQNCPIEIMDSRSVVGDNGLIGTDVFEDFLVELDFPNEMVRLSQLPRRPGEAQQDVALKNEEDDSDDDTDDAAPASNLSDPKSPNSKSPDSQSTAKADAKSPDHKPASPSPFSGPQDRYIAPEMQSYTRFFRFGHDVVVPTTIGKVPYKLFIIDTGALTNFISPAAAREVTKVHGNSDMIVEGISGRVDKVYSANKAILQFGHLRQENQDMTAFDTTGVSDSVGAEISGFLGFTTLRFLDIKIDYRDALVDFQYDAKSFSR